MHAMFNLALACADFQGQSMWGLWGSTSDVRALSDTVIHVRTDTYGRVRVIASRSRQYLLSGNTVRTTYINNIMAGNNK